MDVTIDVEFIGNTLVHCYCRNKGADVACIGHDRGIATDEIWQHSIREWYAWGQG
ncbi:hypothetical protein [Erwinia psidii]|uniref:hypothetical protein n=1 Tax=Erwinia psidii TaxID=69224 RepID=UPI001F46E574|nr:hypothetical protein [Erwinia psidii]